MSPSLQYTHIPTEREIFVNEACPVPNRFWTSLQHDCNPDYCNHKQCDVHAFAFALTHLSAQPTSSSTPTWPTQPSPAQPSQPASQSAEADPSACLPFFQKGLACLSFFQKSVCRSWMPSIPFIHPSARPAPTRLTSSSFHQVSIKLH